MNGETWLYMFRGNVGFHTPNSMDPLGYFTRTNVYKHCKEFEIHPRSQIAVLAPQEAAPIRDFRADSPASTK